MRFSTCLLPLAKVAPEAHALGNLEAQKIKRRFSLPPGRRQRSEGERSQVKSPFSMTLPGPFSPQRPFFCAEMPLETVSPGKQGQGGRERGQGIEKVALNWLASTSSEPN